MAVRIAGRLVYVNTRGTQTVPLQSGKFKLRHYRRIGSYCFEIPNPST
jgi:hypothetical protein